jgi:membrane fusion protein (multidrug efflux system)
MKTASAFACLVLLGAATPVAAAGVDASQVSCVVLPSQHLMVASTVPGIVRTVHVERGAAVRKGGVLMDLASDLELAQEKLSATKADLMKRKLDRNDEAIQKHLISDQERDQLESDARLAQEEYEVAHRAVLQKTTFSPIDGIVVTRKAEPGQYVGTDPAFELVSLNPLNVELVFKVDAYGKIKAGAPASIGLGQPINGVRRGTVAIVDRVIDARSSTFGVRVKLPNPDLKIPSGVSCKAVFDSGK